MAKAVVASLNSIHPDTEHKKIRFFLGSVLVTVILCLCGVFAGIAIQHSAMVHNELLNRARTDFRNIVAVRAWNAGYGGVYVLKREGVDSSIYLPHPDLATSDGRVLTLRNPAVMTREISAQLDSGDEGYSFHIASLKPVNPSNVADSFEKSALIAFEQGEQERFQFEDDNRTGRRFFRYMAPLYVEKSCLECHADQGYRLGDVRGGISVRFDATGFDHELHGNLILIIIVAVLTILILTALITFFTRRLIEQLRGARKLLEEQAMTDSLTGLFNRRHLLELFTHELSRSRRTGHSLSCLLLDIDHFKKINDHYGHLTGDAVLRHLSALIAESVRPYDLFGRYGGEEFLLVLPETGAAEALVTAERFRVLVEQRGTPADLMADSAVTVSIGVAVVTEEDEIDDLIKRADVSLYRAKEGGRNRVVFYGDGNDLK